MPKPYRFTDSDSEGSYAVVWRHPHYFLGRVRAVAWAATYGKHTCPVEFGTREQAADELVKQYARELSPT
jgi:hypothetical protein